MNDEELNRIARRARRGRIARERLRWIKQLLGRLMSPFHFTQPPSSPELGPRKDEGGFRYPPNIDPEITWDLRRHSAFEVRMLPELPGAPVMPVHYPGRGRGGAGLILRIKPHNGERWIGVFPMGKTPTIHSCPNPNELCVAAGGTAVVVRADSPMDWWEPPALPVTFSTYNSKHNLLIFADFTDVCAWGESGLKWRSERIAWDDLVINEVTDDYLAGTGYDPTNSNNQHPEFRLNIADGTHTGGSYTIR